MSQMMSAYVFMIALVMLCLIPIDGYMHATSTRFISKISILNRNIHSHSNNHLLQSSTSAASEIGKNVSYKTSTNTLLNINRLVLRVSWISWWIQIVLSVISGVILTFANTVRIARNGQSVIQSLWGSGFAFSVIGVTISFINSFWTWNITRLIRRNSTSTTSSSGNTNMDSKGSSSGGEIQIIATIKRYCQFSVALSLVGQFVALLGAEQIVGTLASKVLSQGVTGMVPLISTGTPALQALDIFLVQANTNTLVAHFVPLLCYIWIQTQLP